MENSPEYVFSQAPIPSRPQPGLSPWPWVGHIVLVASGKGGVGKSTVARGLATSLASMGAQVGLMDADLQGPNVGVLMGAGAQSHVQTKAGVIPAKSHGVKWFSMSGVVDDDTAMIWRGPMVANMLVAWLSKIQFGNLDYLIVDCPPGTGDVYLTLAQKVPISGVVLVSTPDTMAVKDTWRCYQMFLKLQVHVMGYVNNMVAFWNQGQEIPMWDHHEPLDIPCLGALFFDRSFQTQKKALLYMAHDIVLNLAKRPYEHQT